MRSPTDERDRAAQLVAGMTLAEKASLCSGEDFWHTTALEHHGVPSILLTDGPHGVRLQRGETSEAGIADAAPATCFPTASALAATWDPELVEEVAGAIAREARALGVDVVLGPGANTKRSPLCGRNFEYYSEDPHLTGRMAAAFVAGLQRHGVGASLKHVAANNQEFRRMTIDVVADERSLREIELAGFEHAVRHARPWTVMSAYNRLNGAYASAHPWLLGDVLRDQWGHTGIVVSDWGAVHDRVPALAAGCDLEMPGTHTGSDQELAAAVGDGRLAVEVLDAAATRLVALALHAAAERDPEPDVDHETHHALARRVAGEAVVLLRNERAALPIAIDDDSRVAVLGGFATHPRYQGTGSSRIVPTRLDDLHTQLSAVLGHDRLVVAPGYLADGEADDRLLAEAVAAARDADVAVVCVGLPEGYENEGEDRSGLALPPGHDALVHAVAEVHDRVVVVLSNGAPVTMPWVDDVAAIVEGYLGGQAGGGGLADVLTGRTSPAGRLAETFPRDLADTPTHRWFPGGPSTVEYREGVYVGYRYHDTVDGDVLFPFGHGLGYAPTTWGAPSLDRTDIDDTDLRDGATVRVTVPVTNDGDVPTAEVVQVYVRDVEASVHRPDRELRGFAKVRLAAGETAHATVVLDRRAFAWWDVVVGDWQVEAGRFEVLVGASSRDLRGRCELDVTAPPVPARDVPDAYRHPSIPLVVDRASFEAELGRPVPPDPGFTRPFTRDTPIGATAGTPAGRLLHRAVERQLRRSYGDDVTARAMVRSLLDEAPLRTLTMGGLTLAQVDLLVDLVNSRWAAAGRGAAQEVRRVVTDRFRR